MLMLTLQLKLTSRERLHLPNGVMPTFQEEYSSIHQPMEFENFQHRQNAYDKNGVRF